MMKMYTIANVPGGQVLAIGKLFCSLHWTGSGGLKIH